MSYYRPSFSQTVAMSRGSGRGYSSRGSSSYGSSGRGSSWSDRGRGGFSSNRGGRYSSYNSNNNFDSRSRYQSSSTNERYSGSRGREESGYRRSYRSDGPNYSSNRDSSSHRSPDRKRMRLEASSRRSHEGGYGGEGYSSTSRYEAQSSYNDRRPFNDERRSFKSREDYRKPSSLGGAVRTTPRGGYRGRIVSRGSRGARLSMRDTLIRRRFIDSGSYVRKRGAPLRNPSEYLRRKMVSRIRSAALRRNTIKKREKSSEKEDSEKDESWEDDNAEKKDDEEKTDEKKSTKKSPKKDKDKDDSSDKEEKKSGSEDERPRSKITGRPFIRLTCVHCGMKCVTFKEYSVHLYNERHMLTMRKIAMRQKSVVARMRLAQRNTQRELEKNDSSLSMKSNFCQICKLNYRQQKATHQMSEAHRNMKKFLMPYCHVCRITFKSPMLYENHICSLEHIKTKAHNDLLKGNKMLDKESSPVGEDHENFMTLDSVGDVDEEDEEGTKTPKSPSAEDANKTKDANINVGAEHIKKVEVYYCLLCRLYLSQSEDMDRIIKNHCKCRKHLTRYVRFKEDRELRKQAELIHRKSQEEAKDKEDKDKDNDKDNGEDKGGKVDGDVTNDEDPADDKMWADVDKDLGEILAEVNTENGNKSSDEDEDSRPAGERYDRFRYSEKAGEEKGEKKPVISVKEEDEEEEEEEENKEDAKEEEGKGDVKEEEDEKADDK